MLRTCVSLGISMLLAIPVACSSDDAEDPCPIVGTYAITVTKVEAETEGCKDAPPSDGNPTIVTIRAIAQSAFALEFSGQQGACPADISGTCKIQGTCTLNIADAKDPANAKGTKQYSWTFDTKGFTGLVAETVPAATSLPKGCTDTLSVAGARR